MSNALVFSDAIRRFSKPEHAALIKLVKRGDLSVEKRSSGGQTDYVLVKRSKPQGPSVKLSVTLTEPTAATGVTQEDIDAAFPASQGFSVRPVNINWTGDQPAVGYLVSLPNGQMILIDPTHDRIAFDPTKAAADWGLDPASVARFGVARGKWSKAGAQIDGLGTVGVIDLLKTSGPASLSHEKFHGLFEFALTEDERLAILARYQTEERAAEAFRRSEGFTRGFWDKMQRFIEWLANLVRGDAFRKLRAPLSAAPSQPTGRTEPQYSLLQDVFSNPEQFLSKPYLGQEEKASLQRQAGVQAGLVPNEIADEIRTLNPSDPVEARVASRLEFILQLHDKAAALELRRILDDQNIPEHEKEAAVAAILRQMEHIRVQGVEIERDMDEAAKTYGNLLKNRKKIKAQELIEQRAKLITQRLAQAYKAYLNAQAANLPANTNLAQRRMELINRMASVMDGVEQNKLDTYWRALSAIAERISELPVSEGPQAVIDAIRQKGILRGKVDDDTANMLTEQKIGDLQPLLLNPSVNEWLRDLADLQSKAERFEQQIDTFEKAFASATPGQPSTTGFKQEKAPVDPKKFAETYRQFRNQQAEAAKALRDYDRDFRVADENLQVHSRSFDIVNRLQVSPEFTAQREAATSRPGGEILRDIYETDPNDPAQQKIYVSPLKHQREDGTEYQNKFRVSLAPDKQADEETLRQMNEFKAELEEYLAQPNLDPLDRQTWQRRLDYIKRWTLTPMWSTQQGMMTWDTPYGTISLNPGKVVELFGGGRSRSVRSEAERLAFRAAREANTAALTTDQAMVGYQVIANNPSFGDAALNVSTLDAIKSHEWPVTNTRYWDEHVLNPILAAGQTSGQMRLKTGDFIPGTGVIITKEDMDVAEKQKRYSHAVVRTTQGTAKDSPVLVRNNPILIEDAMSGKAVLRGALSPGPLTMARRFSIWGQQFTQEWLKAPGAAVRKRLVTAGDNFTRAALGYVTTTNPEFQNNSPLKPIYDEFTARARQNEDYQVQSLDQLVERLSDIAMERRSYTTAEEAKAEIEAKLLQEIGTHVDAIQAQYVADKIKSDTPQTMMQFASASSAFTKKRNAMVAPDPYYDYTLTHDSDRIGFVGAGLQHFQQKEAEALERLLNALKVEQSRMEKQIVDLTTPLVTQRQARNKVQKESVTKLQEARFTYGRMVHAVKTLEKVLDALQSNVIDVRDPNDSAAIFALSRFSKTMSSALLSPPSAIINNLTGGGLSTQWLTMRNIGMARTLTTIPKGIGNLAGSAVKRLLLTFKADTPIGKLARSNMPVFKDLARGFEHWLKQAAETYSEMETWGLRAKPDLRNRMRAMAELKATAGRIEREDPKALATVFNYIESAPIIRQILGQVRDKFPRIGDEIVNQANLAGHRSDLFDNLKLRAKQAFETREQLAQNPNHDFASMTDFSKEENLLSPKELGIMSSTGNRDAYNLRQMFDAVGSLDAYMLDYYLRQKAAPESEKANVPFFADPVDEGSVAFNLGAHGNIPTSGFTPPSMTGVGMLGLIKKLIFMFGNYPLRHAAQAERLLTKDLKDPKGWREATAMWSAVGMLIVWLVSGMLAGETGTRATQVVTGRSPTRLTLANVVSNPDAATLARYAGMALANNIPYYGNHISQLLGNPGYGSWWDAAEIIPTAGLLKDLGIASKRVAQTGDVYFPLVDLMSRWFPPASPLTRFLPDVAGDIEARNAARALRTVGPSAGMELAGGGGGIAQQSPATIATRRLLTAAYRGDQEGIRRHYEEAVEARRAAGSADPERAVLQSLAGAVPARRVFGRSITTAEESDLMRRMSTGQRSDYVNAQSAFDLINQTLGTQVNLTTAPKARTRGQATRRSLFSDSASPIFATRRSRSRRRRLGGRRRSGFRRLQIRGSSRRKRRSPARFSFSA